MNNRRQLLRFLGIGTVGAAGTVLALRPATAGSADVLAGRMIKCAALRKEIDRFRTELDAIFEQRAGFYHFNEVYRGLDGKINAVGDQIHELEAQLRELESLPT